MTQNYFEYWNQRWIELKVKERSQGLPIDSQEIKNIQCGALIQVCGELRLQGHLDVGVLSKPSGNNWEMSSGVFIACDIMALKNTDASGNVTGNEFVTVDCITAGMSPNANPSWQVQGVSNGVWLVPLNTSEPPAPLPPDKLDQITWLCTITYNQTVENGKKLDQVLSILHG